MQAHGIIPYYAVQPKAIRQAVTACILTTTARRKPPDTGSCVRGFFIWRCQCCTAYRISAGLFVVIKAPAYGHVLLGFS